MMRRFSSITLTAMVRCEVASGIETLAAMFSAMRPAAPRNGCNCSPGARGGAGAAVPLTCGRGSSNTCFQLSSTVERSRRYCWYSSSSSQLLTPISDSECDAICGGTPSSSMIQRGISSPGTDKTAMNFRRLLPEIRWQPCLSPVPGAGPSICNVPDATLTSNQVPTLRITHSAGQVEAALEGDGPRKIERRPFTFTLSPQGGGHPLV